MNNVIKMFEKAVYIFAQKCYNKNKYGYVYQVIFCKIVSHLWNRRIKMSTLERTVSMMKVLPEADLVKIQNFTENLFRLREHEADNEVGRFLKPMTKDDFLRDMEIAEQQFANGEYQEMGEAIDEVCRELRI